MKTNLLPQVPLALDMPTMVPGPSTDPDGSVPVPETSSTGHYNIRSHHPAKTHTRIWLLNSVICPVIVSCYLILL